MIHELTRSFVADNSQTGICLCPWLAFHISCSSLAGRPSINSSSSISRSSNTSLVGSVGRRADLHRVWTRGRSTLPYNKRCSDEQAQCIFLPSDSVVSVIRSSPDKSTSLPARCYFDFSLPRPGLFHTTVHTTGVQSIQYARFAGRRSLKRVLLVEVRYATAFLQPSANSFGTLCVVKEDGEIEHLPPSRRPLDRVPAHWHARASKLTLTMTHTTAHTALHQRFQRSGGSGQRKEKSRFSTSIPDAFR